MPNLYLIQTTEEYIDHYESAVVCANSEAEAKCIHPNDCYIFTNGSFYSKATGSLFPVGHFFGWTHPKKVQVTLIGVATDGIEPGTSICASYRAE